MIRNNACHTPMGEKYFHHNHRGPALMQNSRYETDLIQTLNIQRNI